MTARDLATRLVALRIVKDWITEADQTTRQALLAEAVQGERIAAVVQGPDGPITVGAVTATKGRSGATTASVTDEQALLRWCRCYLPSALAETVRASDQKVLLDAAKTYGGWMDKTTGTITQIDGITTFEPVPGTPGLMVVPSDDAEELIRAAVEDGRLSLADLPGPLALGEGEQ